MAPIYDTPKPVRGPPVLHAQLLGMMFRFHTAPGLFSTEGIDDGTRLLLGHLPPAATQVLDLGCGYGALGVPVAARFPAARCLLVDRNLRAVACARHNALEAGVGNVETKPSLGYRELGDSRFDLVLCNVPARIGPAGMDHLLGGGARRLVPGGKLRAVVINDLMPTVKALAEAGGWSWKTMASGPRHTVISVGPPGRRPEAEPEDFEAIYVRDQVTFEAQGDAPGNSLTLERAHDLSEDPDHLRHGLPLLLDLLPRQKLGEVRVWRGSYGAVAVTLAARGARVIAADSDLLPLAFTLRNARRLGFEVRTQAADDLAAAMSAPESRSGALAPARPAAAPELLIAELVPALGAAALRDEVATSVAALARGSQALWLGRTRVGRDALAGCAAADRIPLASRGDYSVWRLRPSAARRTRG